MLVTLTRCAAVVTAAFLSFAFLTVARPVAAADDGLPARVRSGACGAPVDQSQPATRLNELHRGVIARFEDDAQDVADAVKDEADRIADDVASDAQAIDDRIADWFGGDHHPSVTPIYVSETVIDTPIADLTAEPNAIDVFKGGTDAGNLIACGQIVGQIGATDLVASLTEVDHSGFAGTAWFRADGDRTRVTVVVYPAAPTRPSQPAS